MDILKNIKRIVTMKSVFFNITIENERKIIEKDVVIKR